MSDRWGNRLWKAVPEFNCQIAAVLFKDGIAGRSDLRLSARAVLQSADLFAGLSAVVNGI
ncbi:MAG: hypothetical protein BWK80_00810 [Desulfobacteraceae bacterium IS3]|nr:MAG: hypothetical protein BWK80_00810 [Desulfobacteraceae bacterium IS3]